MSFSVFGCLIVKLQEKADLSKLSISKSLPIAMRENYGKSMTLNVWL